MRRGLRLISLAAIPVLVLSACSGSSSKSSGAVTVRWYVGLGGGTQPNQIDAQKKFVADYNAKNKNIQIKLDIVPNSTAYDILKTQLAGGNAPDIVGPVGIRGRASFQGLFLDLTDEIKKNKFDTSVFPKELTDFFKNEGQVGLPYVIYPAYMFYNKDLFQAAGLPDLPTTVGEQYQGKAWDWDAVKTIGQTLTLDEAGKHPADAGFDKTKIVQFGIDFQWWDGRRMASSFGGGSFLQADGKTAQIPDSFKTAWKWYYDAMWVSSFAPTGPYVSSALLNAGTTVSSGKVAMDGANGWSINSYGTKGKTTFQKWDIAVLPANAGKTSGPLDADTFTITKASKHPDEAFKAMTAILADPSLKENYGGMPAATAEQDAFFAAFQKNVVDPVFPGNTVTWSVLKEMQKYPADPSHEAWMPNYDQAVKDYSAFYTKLQNTDGLDVNAELDALQKTLQADFDAVKPLS